MVKTSNLKANEVRQQKSGLGGCHFYQLRTGNYDYNLYGLIKSGEETIGKMFPGLISISAATFRVVGSESGMNNIK